MTQKPIGAKAPFVLSALLALAAAPFASALDGAAGKEIDSFDAGRGELKITFLGHASLVFEFDGSVIYIDPVRQYADFSKFPKADLILVTHEHGDHLDSAAIASLRKPDTRIILSQASRAKLGMGEALAHGSVVQAAGISVEAVPAYNNSAGRTGYHPKERKDNGYILTAGTLHVYVAGDTEPTSEMEGMGEIDIAFLPMNLPYTMTPEQVAAAAKTIRPGILYPYHFGSTDVGLLAKQLADDKGIEVRVRKLQ
jgi:L-ascorbate metabolism protein UlaG (beta-lactamase superfamily)